MHESNENSVHGTSTYITILHTHSFSVSIPYNQSKSAPVLTILLHNLTTKFISVLKPFIRQVDNAISLHM